MHSRDLLKVMEWKSTTLADNSQFVEHAWKNDANGLGQSIQLAGVNAHFQNGRAEKKIHDLQDMARMQLIHVHQ